MFREVLPEHIPDYEVREQQIEMALLVERALQQERHALVEAGTGTGKSFAYLVPLALNLGSGRAVVSTGTIALQEQLLHKDIPFLEQALGVGFRAMLAKGKGNYLCLQRWREEMQSPSLFEADQFRRLLDWAEHTETGDRSELDFAPGELWGRINPDDSCAGRKCFFCRDCFFVRARAKLQDAGLIICNHALFFTDLNVRTGSGGRAGLLPGYQVVVLDEAHHVEDVARQSMSTMVSSMRLPVLLFQVRRLDGCNLDALNAALGLNNEFFAAVAEFGPGGLHAGDIRTGRGESGRFLLPNSDRLRSLGEDLLQAVARVKTSFAADLLGEREEALLGCLDRYASDLQEILEADDDNKVFWVELVHSSRRQLVTLHATHLDVSGQLAQSLFENEEIASVVMTSATLSVGGSFDYLKNAVGCASALEASLPSPFNFARQCLFYMPPDLPDPRQPDFYTLVAPVVESILRSTDGRAFVLFTSYRGMNEVYDLLAGRLPWRVLRQGDLPRQKLLEEFRQDLHSVLFATSSFWEGVDVKGEALACVILVKLPFAVPDDPVTEAMVRAIEKSGRNAFMSYTLPEAVLRLKQGFGRLIRTQHDRGLVAILDLRLRTKWYGRFFLNALPRCCEIFSLEDVDV
ncbi:MAG: helicase C-terminal domain-containing protein [Thermacetogeniaceae bacterium]